MEAEQFVEGWTIEKTQDEYGEVRFYVSDPNGDWVGESHPTYEFAAEERKILMQKAEGVG